MAYNFEMEMTAGAVKEGFDPKKKLGKLAIAPFATLCGHSYCGIQV